MVTTGSSRFHPRVGDTGVWTGQVFGAHPSIGVASLFGDHMRLLGTNPANWTRNPTG